MPCFDKVLRDSEAEVRVAAAGKVAAFCKVLTADQVRQAHACSGYQLTCIRLDSCHNGVKVAYLQGAYCRSGETSAMLALAVRR